MSEKVQADATAYEKVTIWTRDGLTIQQYVKANRIKMPSSEDKWVVINAACVPRENFRCMVIEPSSVPTGTNPGVDIIERWPDS